MLQPLLHNMPVHIEKGHGVADGHCVTVAAADWRTNGTAHPVNGGVTRPSSERQRDQCVMHRLILVAVDTG